MNINKQYIIAASRPWYKDIGTRLEERTGNTFICVHQKNNLTENFISSINPSIIFFPHWSWIIPEAIWMKYECIIFHMTDLPFGRGGSPLQNLISRGIFETKISALRCEGEIDSGPIYAKHTLSLYGDAEEIYLRASNVITNMISDIVNCKPIPIPQQGDVNVFQRRTPEQSEIKQIFSLTELFDHIRMLDADGYPRAFLKYNNLRIEFSHAHQRFDRVEAHVSIQLEENPQKGQV